MRIFLLLLLISANQIIHCQETARIVKYFPHSKQISEEYDVLVSNRKIKHGYYAKYFQARESDYKINKNGFLLVQGYYINNLQDSIWTFFNNAQKENNIRSIGKYNKGKKTGVWQTYIENGWVIKRFDYDKNQELEPIFNFTCNYPQKAQEADIQGKVKVFVKYKIDCKIDTIYIMQSTHKYFEDVTLKDVIKLEKLKEKYSLKHNCSNKTDTTYLIIYKME